MGRRQVQVNCGRCGKPFMANVADRNRGWGKFCSKTCKAVKQEQTTGQYAAAKARTRVVESDERNWRGSGVDRETYEHYQNEYGGTPQFSRSGVYEGFTMSREELSYGGYGDADWDTPFGDGKWGL